MESRGLPARKDDAVEVKGLGARRRRREAVLLKEGRSRVTGSRWQSSEQDAGLGKALTVLPAKLMFGGGGLFLWGRRRPSRGRAVGKRLALCFPRQVEGRMQRNRKRKKKDRPKQRRGQARRAMFVSPTFFSFSCLWTAAESVVLVRRGSLGETRGMRDAN